MGKTVASSAWLRVRNANLPHTCPVIREHKSVNAGGADGVLSPGGHATRTNRELRKALNKSKKELEDARLKSERQSQLLAAAEAARCAAEEDRGRIEPRFARPDQAAWLLLVTRLKVDLDVTRGRQAACEARLREQDDQASPLLAFIDTLMTRGRLDAPESAELAQLVLAQNKKHLLDNWLLKEDKLEPSEALGDLLSRAGDPDSALRIYQRANVPGKVIEGLAAKGDFDALSKYCAEQGFSQGYLHMYLDRLCEHKPEGAVTLAKTIARMPGPWCSGPVNLNTMADLFLRRNMVREATAFLVDVLQDNVPEQDKLQTKLLEINLIQTPAVADVILANGVLTHYDRPRIAQLCEKAGMYMRALQHCSDLPDIKRFIVNTHAIDPQQLVEFFGSLSADWALECLKVLLKTNDLGNLHLVVQVAKEYTEQLGKGRITEMLELLELLEAHKSYHDLGGQIALCEDPEVHYKYIEAAAKIGQLKEVERVTRESMHYPPERTKQFLMEANLLDPRPLINVCDRHDMVADLMLYLCSKHMLRYIEDYVQKVSPAKALQVVAGLLDLEAPGEYLARFVSDVILSMRSLIPVETLCAEVEKRNRLKLLNPSLEHLVSEGSTDPAVDDALASRTGRKRAHMGTSAKLGPAVAPAPAQAGAKKRRRECLPQEDDEAESQPPKRPRASSSGPLRYRHVAWLCSTKR